MRLIRLHYFGIVIYARNADQMVSTCFWNPWLAYRILESSGRCWFHSKYFLSLQIVSSVVKLMSDKLSGALGPAHGDSGAEYESSLATFWGSWAFLIGSLIQW